MKIYLDDVRELPEEYQKESWMVVRHPDTLITIIEQIGLSEIEVISFDHDLGEPPMLTGYDVLKYIERRVAFNALKKVPEFRIHSANPVGRKNMEACINSINRIIMS